MRGAIEKERVQFFCAGNLGFFDRRKSTDSGGAAIAKKNSAIGRRKKKFSRVEFFHRRTEQVPLKYAEGIEKSGCKSVVLLRFGRKSACVSE